MQISVPVTFDATNQTMSVSDSGLITFPQNTSDFSIVTVNGMDCITPTTVALSNGYVQPEHYIQFTVSDTVEEVEFDSYADITGAPNAINLWVEFYSDGRAHQYSLVYDSGNAKWLSPDNTYANLPTQQWYSIKIVNNDSIKFYNKSTGTLVYSRSFTGKLSYINLGKFYANTNFYLANLVLKRTINTELIRYANTSGIAEIWANIKNWVSAHIGNGTLTIQKNGTDVTTFSANSSSNATANITVPTKVSDLTNDSGFLTTANIPSKTSDLVNDSGFLTSHQSLSNYVTLDSSQILTATKNFTTNINTSSTSTTSRETWRLVFNKDSADTDSTAAAQIGLIQGANNHNFAAVIRLANPRANNKPTTGNTANCWSGIGVYYNYDENKGYPSAINCWDWPTSSNSTNELASTSWVRTYCETTKGFLTSHQSLGNYVTLNSAQTISGAKKFTGGVTLSNTAKMTVNHATIVKGTNPSSTQYWQIFNCDKNGGNWGTNTLSIIEGALSVNGRSSIYFRACKNEADSTASGALAVIYDTANNKTWAECPTPDANSNDTKIATTAWVNSKGYLTSHQSLAGYLPLAGGTMTGDLTIKGATLKFSSLDTTEGSTTYRTDTLIKSVSSNTKYGLNVLFGSSGGAILGAGEGKDSLLAELAGTTPEDVYIIADGSIHFHPNANTYANKKTVTLDTSANLSGLSTVTATTFSGNLTGNVTGNVSGSSGSCTGNAANVTGTVAVAHGGTGATTRTAAFKNLTNEDVGTSAQYFITITTNHAKCGYSSVANVKTVLGLKSAAYTESSAYATANHTHSNYLTAHQSLSNYSTLANTVKSLSISGKTITVTPGSGNAYTLTTQDTVYTHPTSAGNKHIPSGGSSGQILKYSASGTAVWADASFTRQMVSIATDSFDNALLNRTKTVTLTKSQLAVVTVDLTTLDSSLVKLTASNVFVVAIHTLVGTNAYKQDSVNYGCILQQGATGRTRVVALIYPYNTSVEFTLAKVSGSVNPFRSYSFAVYQ